MTKRPTTLRIVPTPEQRRGRRLHREVSAIVRRNLEEACDRAWAEVAERCGGRPPMLALYDPAAAPARVASRSLLSLVGEGLTRLAIAALVPPARRKASRVRWTGEPPRLAAIQGGRRRESPLSS